jgi:hypothetical protein
LPAPASCWPAFFGDDLKSRSEFFLATGLNVMLQLQFQFVWSLVLRTSQAENPTSFKTPASLSRFCATILNSVGPCHPS